MSIEADVVFVVRSRDPLDHEGSPDVVAVLSNEYAAKELAEKLGQAEQEYAEARRGDRWRDTAVQYTYEEWPVHTSAASAKDGIDR
jgi:hypothetical protein